jgi:hypothetical protein
LHNRDQHWSAGIWGVVAAAGIGAALIAGCGSRTETPLGEPTAILLQPTHILPGPTPSLSLPPATVAPQPTRPLVAIPAPLTPEPVLETGDVYFIGDDVPAPITGTLTSPTVSYSLEWVKNDRESAAGEVYTGVGALYVTSEGGRIALLPTSMLTRKGVYILSGDNIARRRILLVDPVPQINDPQTWPFGLITSADKIDRGAAMAEELYRIGVRWFHFDYPISNQFYFDWPYSVNAIGASSDPQAGRITPGFESFINRAHALGLNPIFKLMNHYADIDQPGNLDGPFYTGLRKIQTYYQGKLKYWVIGNEVEGGGYSQFSPDEYATVVKNMSRVLKGVDPGVRIIAGEFYSADNVHLDRLLQPEYRDEWDILSGHNVVRIRNGNAPASAYKARLQGLDRPFWDTEANGTTFGGPSEWSGYMFSGFPTGPDHDLHSGVNKHIIRAFCLEARAGGRWVPAFYNPETPCLGADLFIGMHYNANWEYQWSLRGHWSGPLEADHIDEQNHKVADFRAVTDLLYGATGLTRIPNLDAPDPAAPGTTYTGADGYVYRYGDEYLVMLWRNTGDEGQDREVVLITDPQERVVLYDSFGNASPLRNENGVVKVWVRPEVVYVRGFTRLPAFALDLTEDAPYFVTTPITQAVVGQPYVYTAWAYDSDVPPTFDDSMPHITYSLINASEGMSLVEGGLTWTPTAPGEYAVTLLATSGHGAPQSVEQTFTLHVVSADAGLPPDILSIPTTTFARVGYVWWYNVNARDPNGEPVTYALAQAPEGMTMDPASGFIQWTPVQAGDFTVTVAASDGARSTSQTFVIHVGA